MKRYKISCVFFFYLLIGGDIVANSALSKIDAENRAKQIKHVDYTLFFDLPESAPQYSGLVTATFEFLQNPQDLKDSLFLDFTGGKIANIKLNGVETTFSYNGEKISIAPHLFKIGTNTLQIEFSHPYGDKGMGFHRTQDSADHEYYMYSDFEPYNANKAFPLFDQPDLKATFTLSLKAPAKWEVIANERETAVTNLGDGTCQWQFPPTARISSYLFALIAGPFTKWEDKTKSGIAMRLFARKSLAHFLEKDVKHWFEVTNAGFKYFEKAFSYPYPFSKYDQILTPDYNHGAMENVGAVTFSEESFIFKTDVTPLEVLHRVETIIHELSHMWFGNLVTMKWWDDLWLNESFATYASNLAMSKFANKLGLANVWQQFYSGNKLWAYREDDFVTTHPIVGEAKDSEEALANFDGITYGKGASALKQLVFYMGEEKFLNGVQNYFKKYAFKNATRSDFLNTLEESSNLDLTDWETRWLKSSGTNSVKVLLTIDNGIIDELCLEQVPDSADGIFRPHKTKIGFYDLNTKSEFILRETLDVTYDGKLTKITEAKGKKAPAFIFPNVDDHDFAHAILDQNSLNTLKKSLVKIQDPFLRQMLWGTLWNMVRHAKLSAQEFASIALANLEDEKDLSVLELGISYLSSCTWFMAQEIKEEHKKTIEKFISKLFHNSEPSSYEQIYLFQSYVNYSFSQESLAELKNWLSQEEAVPGITMDQERRWDVIISLAINKFEGSKEMATLERTRDQTDSGLVHELIAHAAYPEMTDKKIWWDKLLNAKELSIERARRIMGVFQNTTYPEVTEFMEDDYFVQLANLALEDEYMAYFTSLLFPCNPSLTLLAKVTKFLDEHPNIRISIKKALRKQKQSLERTLAARELSKNC